MDMNNETMHAGLRTDGPLGPRVEIFYADKEGHRASVMQINVDELLGPRRDAEEAAKRFIDRDDRIDDLLAENLAMRAAEVAHKWKTMVVRRAGHLDKAVKLLERCNDLLGDDTWRLQIEVEEFLGELRADQGDVS